MSAMECPKCQSAVAATAKFCDQCGLNLVESVEFLHRKAVDLYHRGQIDEALTVWDRALAVDPQFGKGHYYRGLALYDRGDLADAVEALIGAVHLDGGFSAASEFVGRLYATRLDGIVPGQQIKDPKTRLQEYLQGRRLALPKYVLIDTSGEAHAQNFRVCCDIPALRLKTEGIGQSRRAAEQMAAEKALEAIG